MKNLKLFLISCLLPLAFKSPACMMEYPERWYMMCYHDDEFNKKFDKEMNAFWIKYTGKEWWWDEDRMEAAQKKRDQAMVAYLKQLKQYETICSDIRDLWSYPTKTQLAQRKRNLQNIVAECGRHTTGKYADRWLLLQMRCNILLDNYQSNISLWNNRAKKLPDSCYKDMMRNIYANALLNTGKKIEAWNIYAEQNDVTSLVWSVRKYTNLAGIKKLYAEDPNAPILEYLLQYYVNEIQDVLDYYADSTEYSGEYRYESYDSAYAQIDANYMAEITEFANFAEKVANSGKSNSPGLWMTASALVRYFLHQYPQAKTDIDLAMNMAAPEAVKKATRRIRMLIEPTVADVKSITFRQFMTDELKWLDSDIATTKSFRIAAARDRILNLGLIKPLEKKGDRYIAIALQAKRSENLYHLYTQEIEPSTLSPRRKISNDYSNKAFGMLWEYTGDQLLGFKKYVEAPGVDPLAVYALSEAEFNSDFLNDIIGTKYLAECKFEKALPYLQKVSQDYLNNQRIAHYVVRRNFRIPDWYGYQELGSDFEPIGPVELEGNIKVIYCEEMIRLERQYAENTGDARKALAYEMATYLFQACGRGQCWFLTQYSAGSPLYERDNEYYEPPTLGESYYRACRLLNEAATSTQPRIRALAQFALVDAAPDCWYTSRWASDYSRVIISHNTSSQQYKALKSLLSTLATTGNVPTEISRCDVVKQFRKATQL